MCLYSWKFTAAHNCYAKRGKASYFSKPYFHKQNAMLKEHKRKGDNIYIAAIAWPVLGPPVHSDTCTCLSGGLCWWYCCVGTEGQLVLEKTSVSKTSKPCWLASLTSWKIPIHKMAGIIHYWLISLNTRRTERARPETIWERSIVRGFGIAPKCLLRASVVTNLHKVTFGNKK